MYYFSVSMATTKQPETVKRVAYRNSSSWYMLKLKTLEKSILFIYNYVLFYIMQVWKISLTFKKMVVVSGIISKKAQNWWSHASFIVC